MKILKCIFTLVAMTWLLNTTPAWSKNDSARLNPVIWADVPDPDVIRVGDTYYMVSTTMHLMPGCPVMRSKNLVDWETISYVFDTLDDNSKYRLIDGNVYGRGQWATSIRYHNEKFYVLFSPNDQPYKSYVYTADDPAGKWTLVSRTQHFHDASLLFDDDGKVYVYYGTGQLCELEPDLSGVKEGGINTTIFSRDESETGLLEGSRAIKHDGKYYLLMISWPKNGKRRQVCYRADNIEGPYEKKVILESDYAGFPYVGQGCIFDCPDGSWRAMIFQDRGAVGRVLTVMPCVWRDGWPMLGNAEGRVPYLIEPTSDEAVESNLILSDDFDNKTLASCWQWNHVPDNKGWSLKDAPGSLRLYTTRVVPNIYFAPNTISQRMSGPTCSGSVKIDISGMKDGDVAGFGAFNGHSGLLNIVCEGKKKYLVMTTEVVNFDDKKDITDVEVQDYSKIALKGNNVYLRIDGDFNPGKDIATFYYSMDGDSWQKVGPDFKMVYDYRKLFMGSRFAIYNYATKKKGGHIDVDYFHYDGASNKLPSLASATEGKYLAGVALGVRDINSEAARKLAADNFNCIVAENCMKSVEIHPEEDVYDFTDADKFVEFGVKNNMKIIGHCLIWHSQCPRWFCHDEKGNLVSPEVLKRRMKEHITTVMQRYKGKIHGWDVVNEAIENDGSWRNSDFYKILGAEFIPLAFQYAHEADPDAQLYYNDYSMDAEGKRNTVVSLIRDLKKRGLRIDAVGMQSHVGLHEPTIDEYEKSLLAFVAEGVHVMATEFDVSILPFVHASANISDTAKYDERLNPYRNGVPEEVQFEWNKRVRDFFNLYDKYSDVFDRLTVWGLTDASSWKNNFPIVGRTDYPVFIDRAGKLKPVVYDIIGDYIRNKK